MVATVKLTLKERRLPEKQIVFDKPAFCIVGRAPDCDLRMPTDDDHLCISRHHCLLDVFPPYIRIRDYLSPNGTYVNGVRIATDGEEPTSEEVELYDGDEFRIGNITFCVTTNPAPFKLDDPAKDMDEEVDAELDAQACAAL